MTGCGNLKFNVARADDHNTGALINGTGLQGALYDN